MPKKVAFLLKRKPIHEDTTYPLDRRILFFFPRRKKMTLPIGWAIEDDTPYGEEVLNGDI